MSKPYIHRQWVADWVREQEELLVENKVKRDIILTLQEEIANNKRRFNILTGRIQREENKDG